MLMRLGLMAAGFATATSANAQSALENGFSGAVRGCEEWILNPASWTEGVDPFITAVGLGGQMGLVDSVNEVSLPPPNLRVANHYWRINSTEDAGYVLVVSDQLPMCHITGGGNSDLQPVIESVLANENFRSRWDKVSDSSRDDMASTTYRNRIEPSFTMIISRAKQPGERLDRVQVLATGTMNLGK